MLAIVTNIPTPYRTAFFNVLHTQLQKNQLQLHVFYCANTEPGRHWDFNAEDNKYNFTFLKGFHPSLKGFYPHINFGLITSLKKIKPSWILFAGSWNAPATVNLLFHKKSLNCPMIFWSEGHFDAQVRSNKTIDSLRKKILQNISYFVVPNHKSKEYVLHYNKNAKIDFLPNTVDEDFFSMNIDDSQEKSRLLKNLPLEKKIIVLVSSLDSRKGVLEFYEAFKKANNKNLLAVQIGTGEYYHNLQERIKSDGLEDHYILAGQLHAKDVREYLIAADVFALPTKSDPNPLSPIEASFSKTSLLLSSKAGNAKELVPDANNGWIIPEISEDHLISCINKIAATEKEQLIAMGIRSYDIVSSSFTRKEAANNLISFLKEVRA